MACCKVPANDKEGMASSLMGLWEKKRLIKCYGYVNGCNVEDPSTWDKFDIMNGSMGDCFKKFSLEDNTIDFLGHAVALHYSDTYLYEPAVDTIKKMQLYLNSKDRYGESPFLYPIYGIGGLPESFSRLCAIHGGTYMLNTQVDEILFDENGKVTGIKSGD